MNEADIPRDTMVDAIALSSPSGRMSKRARKAAEERLRLELFGPTGLARPQTPQPPRTVSLRQSAAMLRDLAARGIGPRKHRREADRLELLAEELEAATGGAR